MNVGWYWTCIYIRMSLCSLGRDVTLTMGGTGAVARVFQGFG